MQRVCVANLALVLACLAIGACAAPANANLYNYVLEQVNGTLKVREVANFTSMSPMTVATAIYNHTLTLTGWDTVEITAVETLLSTGNASDVVNAWQYAGYLEGYITAEQIWLNYRNSIQSFVEDPANDAAKVWIQHQMSYMQSLAMSAGNVTEQPADAPAGFITRLGLIWSQLEGLGMGYNAYVAANSATTAAQSLSSYAMFLMSYQPEIGDVETYLSTKNPNFRGFNAVPRPRPNMRQHCSAFIRPTGADLFMAHDTWGNYNGMLRQYKTYRFDSTLSFSSYPGMLNSMDDWYISSNKLAIQETTNGVYNNTLYATYFNSSTVAEWIRVMIANWEATSGQQWTELFVYQNSGSYNNQWMVVDMKLFTPPMTASQLKDNTLWISETLPGYAERADVTDVVRRQGYWASYNIPYFKTIFDLSGNKMMEEQFGSFYSYTNYSRPLIFKRNYSDVNDLEGMKWIMRYNEFQTDPLSLIPNCTSATNGVCDPAHSAMLTVASRGDLDPACTVATMGILCEQVMVGLENLGAIDTKIASWSNMQGESITGVVISGPTTQGQPVFDYRTVAPSIANETAYPRFGVPIRFDFPFMNYTVGVQVLAPPAPAGKNKAIVGIIVGILGGILAIAIVAVVIQQRSIKTAEGAPLVQ